jgi:uncharacterized membrane protein (DUF2068 family)
MGDDSIPPRLDGRIHMGGEPYIPGMPPRPSRPAGMTILALVTLAAAGALPGLILGGWVTPTTATERFYALCLSMAYGMSGLAAASGIWRQKAWGRSLALLLYSQWLLLAAGTILLYGLSVPAVIAIVTALVALYYLLRRTPNPP